MPVRRSCGRCGTAPRKRWGGGPLVEEWEIAAPGMYGKTGTYCDELCVPAQQRSG